MSAKGNRGEAMQQPPKPLLLRLTTKGNIGGFAEVQVGGRGRSGTESGQILVITCIHAQLISRVASMDRCIWVFTMSKREDYGGVVPG